MFTTFILKAKMNKKYHAKLDREMNILQNRGAILFVLLLLKIEIKCMEFN